MSVGRDLIDLLDELYEIEKRPLVIVETGSIRSVDPGAEESDGWSTVSVAKWVEKHEGAKFYSCELDPDHITIAGRILGEHKVDAGRWVEFLRGDSVETMKTIEPHIDFAFLDSCDGLAHGLTEFLIAERKGALLIVMDDYEAKAWRAARYAEVNGWDVKRQGRLTVMRKTRV